MRDQIQTLEQDGYKIVAVPKVLKEGCWNVLDVTISDSSGKQVATYQRNYSSFYNTFYPFELQGKKLALYSKEYTSTRLLDLETGQDIGGEERNAYGFCPVDYFVPRNPENEKEFLPFGFVSGCVWGDDSSWKVQYLDLSNAHLGQLVRDEKRMPYLELTDKLDRLKDCIDAEYYEKGCEWVTVHCIQRVNLAKVH